MIFNITKVFLLFLAFIILGCSKSGNQTSDNKTSGNESQTVLASDKSVEIQCSGMTCTGCESTIKSKVKKIDGVKEVMADHNTNVVKASFDPAKTNIEAIKEAITDAGYKVESVK